MSKYYNKNAAWPVSNGVNDRMNAIYGTNKSNAYISMSDEQLAWKLQNEEFESAYGRKATGKQEVLKTLHAVEEKDGLSRWPTVLFEHVSGFVIFRLPSRQWAWNLLNYAASCISNAEHSKLHQIREMELERKGSLFQRGSNPVIGEQGSK